MSRCADYFRNFQNGSHCHVNGQNAKKLKNTKGIQTNYKSPLFYFHGNCGKVCPTDSDFFGLSCSTRCGCCSYQVSSISVRRVTYYDHFCVFQFFSILAVYMVMTAILKIPKVVCTSTHSA
jgi:hypothetical protein